MKNYARIILTILPFIYMGVIWFLSGHSDNLVMELPSSSADRFIKEAMHLIEFAILYALFAAALAAHTKLTARSSLFAAVIACLYALLDEFHQSFVPSRDASLIDIVKDFIGIAAVYFHVGYHYFKHHRGFLTKIEKLNT
ncbi:VanZ family protein [Bacillus sp. MUM 13]|uniref:VanZ family protein n=1 Tax=Bacillus sp. MUM 13 TaxID=1678001 RepID=UPI0008F55A39|nr:VanZ family protein [Bacillus sp. MUM 13]OIK03776.1 hypothetical protein BIV59_22425 [Bacillus sp. MUM 13]